MEIKWHKVSEGNLPKSGSRVLVYYVKNNHEFYHICNYDIPMKNSFSRLCVDFVTEKVDAIAWMELPKYEG